MRQKSVTAGPAQATGFPIRLAADNWERRFVGIAVHGRLRRRGLVPRPMGRGLLLLGRVVHSIGMSEDWALVALDRSGCVVAVRIIAPRRLVAFWPAQWVLELPAEEPLPAVGAKVMVTRDLTWPHARPTSDLRHADREPR
jgi:hypothetical protein